MTIGVTIVIRIMLGIVSMHHWRRLMIPRDMRTINTMHSLEVRSINERKERRRNKTEKKTWSILRVIQCVYVCMSMLRSRIDEEAEENRQL
jgi:hypothetical protein